MSSHVKTPMHVCQGISVSKWTLEEVEDIERWAPEFCFMKLRG